MLLPIRRVVTGLNAEGRSIVVSDGVAPHEYEMPSWPGNGVTNTWSTTEAPSSNGDEELAKEITAFPPQGTGGVSFMIMQIKPLSELAKMSPEQRAACTQPVADFMPEGMNIDTSKSHGMHATDTTDLLIMLQGELTLIVDEGEVTLRPFDTVVQRGVNHGWENRGTVTALIASAVIDAKPLKRIRKPKPRTQTPQRF